MHASRVAAGLRLGGARFLRSRRRRRGYLTWAWLYAGGCTTRSTHENLRSCAQRRQGSLSIDHPKVTCVCVLVSHSRVSRLYGTGVAAYALVIGRQRMPLPSLSRDTSFSPPSISLDLNMPQGHRRDHTEVVVYQSERVCSRTWEELQQNCRCNMEKRRLVKKEEGAHC
jgi:hypothetical protein